jgi:flagellar protein FlaJ
MLERVALKLFGSLVAPYTEYFEGLKYSMRKARMTATVQQYLSSTLLYSLITLVASLVTASLFLPFALKGFEFTYSYTLAIIISFVAAGIAFFMSFYYPSMRGQALSTRIDRSLPFAASYMATTASSGTNPVNLFKMLSLRGGEVGKEANRIYTNVTSLGMSMTSALQRAALRSPSPTFADLLWGMISIITTGGDMESYLRTKSRTYMSQYRRMLDEYAKQITFYTEIYITLVIVGTLFFIVLISIISPLTGIGALFTQTLLVFFVIPLVSIAFIVLLKYISPSE